MILPIAEFFPELIPHPKRQVVLTALMVPLFLLVVEAFGILIFAELMKPTISDGEI